MKFTEEDIKAMPNTHPALVMAGIFKLNNNRYRIIGRNRRGRIFIIETGISGAADHLNGPYKIMKERNER